MRFIRPNRHLWAENRGAIERVGLRYTRRGWSIDRFVSYRSSYGNFLVILHRPNLLSTALRTITFTASITVWCNNVERLAVRQGWLIRITFAYRSYDSTFSLLLNDISHRRFLDNSRERLKVSFLLILFSADWEEFFEKTRIERLYINFKTRTNGSQLQPCDKSWSFEDAFPVFSTT